MHSLIGLFLQGSRSDSRPSVKAVISVSSALKLNLATFIDPPTNLNFYITTIENYAKFLPLNIISQSMFSQIPKQEQSKVVRQFSRQRYNKYRHQFPGLNEGQIFFKVMSDWDLLGNKRKLELLQTYRERGLISSSPNDDEEEDEDEEGKMNAVGASRQKHPPIKPIAEIERNVVATIKPETTEEFKTQKVNPSDAMQEQKGSSPQSREGNNQEMAENHISPSKSIAERKEAPNENTRNSVNAAVNADQHEDAQREQQSQNYSSSSELSSSLKPNIQGFSIRSQFCYSELCKANRPRAGLKPSDKQMIRDSYPVRPQEPPGKREEKREEKRQCEVGQNSVKNLLTFTVSLKEKRELLAAKKSKPKTTEYLNFYKEKFAELREFFPKLTSVEITKVIKVQWAKTKQDKARAQGNPKARTSPVKKRPAGEQITMKRKSKQQLQPKLESKLQRAEQDQFLSDCPEELWEVLKKDPLKFISNSRKIAF